MSNTFYRFSVRLSRSFAFLMAVAVGIGFCAEFFAATLTAQEAPAAAEAVEATEPSAEEVFLANFDPAKSFSKLLLPYVAQRVGLSEAQQTEVTRLMDERSSKLATAERAQWPTIVTENEAALKAILSPQQLERFESSMAEKKIILRFSKERWEDVLKWLASELGLQLVMDAPPAGTFNYSDKNEYTPKEALDVVCGVLQTKGYTLFRSAEILYLHNFRSGPIPLQFLPKIDPEELPDQSRFDYVALTIPLASRSIETVQEVIKPFKGPYCTTRILSGNALMIVDSVNALREILPVALGVYNPPQATSTPTPTWRDFPLEKTKPTVVRDQVQKFVPSAKPLVNPTSNMISYLALTSEHEVIDGIIGRLEEGGDPARDLTLGVYPLSDITASSQANLVAYARRLGYSTTSYFMMNNQLSLGTAIAAGFQKLAPEANITLNSLTRQLIVVATPDDQAKIKAAVDQLKAPLTDEEKTVYKSYRFDDPAKTMNSYELSALRALIPLAEVTFDTTNQTLLVVGTAAEQEKIAQAVTGMNADYLSEENRQTFAVYPMTAKQLTQFNTLFARLSSTAEMKGVLPIRDGSVNRLSVWATPRQHEQIRRIVDQISGAYMVEAEKQAVEVPTPQGLPPIEDISSADETPAAPAPAPAEPAPAPAEPAPAPAEPAPAPAEPAPAPAEPAPAPAEPAPAEPAPAPAPAPEKTPEQIAAEKAAAEKAAAEKAAADKAAADKAAAEKAAADKAAADKAAAEKAAAEKAAAEKKAAIDAGVQAELAARDAAAEKEDVVVPGVVNGVYLAVIKLEKSYPYSVTTVLNNTIPGIEVTHDPYTKSLVIYGTKSMIAAARRTVERLEKGNEMAMEVVPLTNSFPMETLSAIQRVETAVTVTRDMKRQQLFLFGKPENIVRVRAMLESILAKTAPEDQSVYYLDVTKDFPSTTIDFIQRSVPKSEISFDKDNKRFTIFGTPTDQLTVSKLITDAEQNLPAREEIRYYTMEDRISDKLIDRLKEAVPNIPEVHRDDANPKVLVVKARPVQHDEIGTAIHRIKTELPEKEENTLAFYPMEKEQFDRFEKLRNDFESENGSINILTFQDDRIMVWALPWQHEKLKALIEQIQAGLSAEDSKKVAKLYSPKYVDLTTLSTVVRDLYSSITVSTDEENNRLILRGTLGKVDQALESLVAIDVKDTDGVKRTFAAYDVKSMTSYDKNGNYYSPLYLIRDLQRLVPAAKVTYEVYQQQVIVWGTEEEQQIIKDAVGNLNADTTFNDRFYRHEIRRTSPYTLVSMIRQVFPRVTATVDGNAESVIVQGNNVSMTEVKELCDLLDPENPSPLDPTVAIYPFEREPSAAAVSALKQLAPRARIEINKENRRMMVIARPFEQKLLADNIKAIEGMMIDPEPILAFYTYENEPTEEMMATLRQFAPNAKIENLTLEKKLMVTALPREQQIVSDTLGVIAANSAPGDPILKVYPFEKKPTDALVETLKKFAPDAKYELNADQRRLTVIARPAEIEKIDSQIVAAAEALVSDEPILAIYPLENTPTSISAYYLQTLVPSARIIPNYAEKQMMVIAKPQEQKIVAENIGAVAKALSPSDPVLKVYPCDGEPSSMAAYYLMRLAPNARVDINREDRQILVIARPSDQKIIADNIAQIADNLTVSDPVLAFYPYENEPTEAMMATLRQLAPNAKIENLKIDKKLMVTAKAKEQKIVADTLGVMAENSKPGDPLLKVYPFEVKPTSKVVDTLKKFVPDAQYELDAERNQLAVVARPAEIEKIDAQIEAVAGALVSTEPVVRAYPLESAPTSTVAYTLMRLAPSASIYPDYANRSLMVIAKPSEQKIIAENIGAVAKTLSPSDPELKIYPCESEPTAMTAYTLMRLAPNATVTINRSERSIVVIARPQDQKIIAENIEAVTKNLGTESMKLAVYPMENRPTAEVVASLKKLAPAASIDIDEQARQLLVVATAADQKIIAENITQVAATLAGRDPGMKVFDFENEPTETLVESLKKLAPEATITVDKDQKQLMVIAQPREMRIIEENVAQLSKTFSRRDLKMIAYPIYGMDAAELQASLLKVYPDMKVELDTDGSRLLIWATLEEQVKISEEIAQVNRGTDGEALSEYAGPQVAVYQAENATQSYTLSQMVKKIFPSAEIFADTSYYSVTPKVTILASSREQKQIAAIFEQIKNPLNEEKMSLETFPIGELEPTAVETTLANLLDNAVSGSPIELQRAVPMSTRSYYSRNAQTGEKAPFFRVDPKTKTASVFAKTDDLDRVREGLEKMVLAAGETPQSLSKVYTLISPIASSLIVTLRQIFPSAEFTVSSASELIAYGTQSEIEKIDGFMKGVEDLDGADTHYRFKAMFLPDGSLYSRDAIVSAMNAHFIYERGHAYPGAATNQIVMYGTNKTIEKMAAYVEQVCSVTETESYKTYSISNMPVMTAVSLLTRLCPNTTITPNVSNQTVTVFGTEFVQKRVAEALAEIDAKKSGDIEVTARYYGLDGLPVTSYYPVYYALYYYLIGQHPAATLIGEPSYYNYIIVAPEKDQDEIAQFFAEMKSKRQSVEKRLEVYHLEAINLTKAIPIIQTTAPSSVIFTGKRPNELFVWTDPDTQERIRATLAKLETIEEGGPKGMIPKIYRIDGKAAPTAAAHLTPSVPGAYIYPISMDRIIMWGSEADHKLAGELLGVFAEAYPEQVLAKYSLRYIPLTDLYSFLVTKYYPDAIIYPSSEGDLMVRAAKELQTKIESEIQTLDQPRSDEAKPLAQAYDISDIPVASRGYAVPNILRVVPDAVFLPTVTPGYFVIYAKPESQKKIADLVEQMLKEQPWLKARTERYTLRTMSIASAIPMLRPLAPSAQFAPGRERNQIYVWAKASEHEKIADAIAKMNEETADGIKTRIYRLDRANLLKAQSTLLTLYPGAMSCLVDPATRTLTVNASAELQTKAHELITELDRVDLATQPQVQVFSLSGVNYTSVLMPIRSFYAADPSFQVNYDPTYRSLIVRGSPAQLTFVGNLIDQIQRGGLADPALVFKTYTMRNPWSYYTINSVFTRQGRNLYMFQDPSTGKLIVMARPEEHIVIENLLDALAPEKTQLAIFDLVYVDPQTAYNIITTMLENDGSFVDIHFDASSNRLYVRANAKKLEEVRRFLIGAGEKGLEQMPPIQETGPSDTERSIREKIKIQGDGPLRTIRFEGDLRDILNEVKKNWTRANPLNVIESGSGLIQTESNPTGSASIETVPTASAPATTAPVNAPAEGALDAEQQAVAAAAAAEEVKKTDEAQAAEAVQNANEQPTEAIPAPETAPAVAPIVPAPEAAPAPVTPTPAPEAAPAAEAPAQVTSWSQLKKQAAKGAFRALIPFVWTAAVAADIPSPEPVPATPAADTAQPTETAQIAEVTPATESPQAADPAQPVEAAPGVYVVLNEDGTLTITSNDTEALEAFEEVFLSTIVRLAGGREGEGASMGQGAGQNTDIVTSPQTMESDQSQEKNIRFLARQNTEAARQKLVMEDRNYSVYKVEQVSVDLLLSRLTFYMADRINPPRTAFTPSYAAQAKGINMRTISTGPRLAFTPDYVLNTIMVKGNRADRDEAGAMIAVLDRPELFPQPITKPFKVPVKNTTVQKMATHVLNAFQQKFMATRLPGNLAPRISPNTETNTLEVYAPEDLAKEISEYVQEMDEEILKDPNRKQVQVVKLKQINSAILQKYLNDLRASQPQYNYATPYMFNSNYYYRQTPMPRRF